jgi:glycosyltransferase involved in cell wall biosynthesis
MQKTTFPFVAVVIDDCSSDKTATILREYENRYPDIIKAICLEENYHTLRKDKTHFFEPYDASAKYIAFCEGDDYWTDPCKLQKQVEYLEENPDIGLCYTDYSRANKDLRIISHACFSNGMKRPGSFEDHLLSLGYIAPMTWVFRNEILRQMRIPRGFVDGTFAIALEFFWHSKIGYLDFDTAVHVIHPGSASHQTNPKKKFLYEYRVFKEQVFFAEKYGEEPLATRIKFDKFLSLLPFALRVGNQDFLREAEEFFSSKGACFDDICNLARGVNDYRREIKKARSSKSYRLGSALLKPFRKLIKNG